MTDYIHRYVIVVEIGRLIPANARAGAWDPDTGGADTFGGVRLSPTGDEPATHSACNTAATDEMKALILEAQSHVPWQRLFSVSSPWDFDTVIEAEGLNRIQTSFSD